MKWRYVHMTSTTTIAGTESTLMTVNVNTAAAGSTVTIKDGTNTIGILDGGTIASKGYGVFCPGGINVTIAGGSPDITIGYL